MKMPIIDLHRRGKNYVGDCPYPHAEGLPMRGQLAVSLSRGIYHCFSCGLGGPLPNARDLEQDNQDVILVQLPTHEDATAYMERISMQGMMRALRALPDRLPPNIAPFWEQGEVVEMSRAQWCVRFPATAAVARERVARCKDVIERHIAEVCASTPTLVIA